MASIQMIPIERLAPHPKNPRRELGDLSELADSIRRQGILQNLTVVPGPAEGQYTVIIGHRRRAASLIAGLRELPCAVSEMSESEQIATMMAENMQRNDLSVSEQVMGIRSLLDLVDEKTIAKETGLSKKVVAARASVARGLKQRDVRRAELAGASLLDMLNLSRLPEDRQGAVLDMAEEGKLGLNDAITREAERIQREAAAAEYRKAMWRLGVKECAGYGDLPDTAPNGARVEWRYKDSLNVLTKNAAAELEQAAERAIDSDTLMLATTGRIEGGYVQLYKAVPAQNKEDTKEAREQARRERITRGVQTLKVRMLEKWSRWILNGMWWGAVAGKVDEKTMLAVVYQALVLDSYEKVSLDGRVPGITREAALGAIGLDPEQVTAGEEWEALYRSARWNALVLAGYTRLAKSSTGIITWEGKHRRDPALEKAFAAVRSLGYEAEAWEAQLIDGTHEVYKGELEVAQE